MESYFLLSKGRTDILPIAIFTSGHSSPAVMDMCGGVRIMPLLISLNI